jgi:hypothetical protein
LCGHSVQIRALVRFGVPGALIHGRGYYREVDSGLALFALMPQNSWQFSESESLWRRARLYIHTGPALEPARWRSL